MLSFLVEDYRTTLFSCFFSLRLKLSPYQSNHSKVDAIPVKCLAQGHNKRICRSISTLALSDAERQARKLWIPTFNEVWCDSVKECWSTDYEANALTTEPRADI